MPREGAGKAALTTSFPINVYSQHSCEVDFFNDYSTHKPLIVDILINKFKQSVRELQPATDYAKLIEEKI